MTKLGLLGAAAMVASSALASPAMAQQVIYNPGYCAQYYPNANCQNTGPGNPYTDRSQRRAAYRSSWDRGYDRGYNSGWDRRHDSGFWPGEVAAGAVRGAVGVAGAAVGTAGAIATAPFRGNSNAYHYNDRGWAGESYAKRNAFVCEPGKRFKGADGRQHICQ